MKIETLSGPAILQPNGSKAVEIDGGGNPKESPRDKAIRMLTQPATPTQETPVLNPSKVSPEELSAIKAPQSAESTEESGQKISGDSVEGQAEVKAETKPGMSEEKLSEHYANLARREKALRIQAQKLQSEREALKAVQTAKPAAESTAPTFDSSKFISKDDLLKDPFSILNELGLSYDSLTQSALNQPSQEDIDRRAYEKRIDAKLAEIEKVQNEAKKNSEELQTQSYQQALTQLKSEARSLVNSDPESFEAIKSTNSYQDVVDLIENVFKNGVEGVYEAGHLLTVEEAAKQVEEYLVDEAVKIAQLKKIQNRLKPQVSETQNKAEAPAQKQPQGMKTLTNSISSSSKLSARERAILAFEGRLTNK